MSIFVKATALMSLVVLCALAAAQRPPNARGNRTACAPRQGVLLVNATDNSRQGSGARAEGQEPPNDAEEPAADRLKRQFAHARLDDINIKINAVDNYGAGGQGGGEEEQRFKRQNPGGPGP